MKQLTDLDKMPFGKHRDVPMQDVPPGYLHFLWSNGLKHEVKTNAVADYISRNLTALKQDHPDGIW